MLLGYNFKYNRAAQHNVIYFFSVVEDVYIFMYTIIVSSLLLWKLLKFTIMKALKKKKYSPRTKA